MRQVLVTGGGLGLGQAIARRMAKRAVAGLMPRFAIGRDEAERRVASGNPVDGFISPDEVAAAVACLASPQAHMVDGHGLSVSGGEI